METAELFTAIVVKIGLAVILALSGVAVIRHFHRIRHGWNPPGASLHILETAVLGQQRALHLVAVGGRILLVGSTQGQVAMLADLTDERESRESQSTLAKSGFSALIHRLVAPQAQPIDFQSLRLREAAERLRRGDGAREVG